MRAWIFPALLAAVLCTAGPGLVPAEAEPDADVSVCERMPRAATLTSSDYASLPPRHSATSSPTTDVRALFDASGTGKAGLVKKSIAEENPVLFSIGANHSFAITDGVWTSSKEGGGRKGSECQGPMVAVGYDDARYGGALEVMQECGGGEAASFFWISYDDFEQVSTCGLEAVGRRGAEEDGLKLAGSVRFEDTSGGLMRALPYGRIYRLERSYPSGTEFRLSILTIGAAYVYVFASDVTGRVYPIFPDEHGSPHLAYMRNRIAFPDEEGYLHLDDKPGTDYVCALYSTRKIDFPDFVQQMEKAEGTFPQRLQATLAKDLVDDDDVQYASSGELSFSAKSTDRSIVPVVVEIRHL